ncbi:MAG: DNA integrity scanning protein DisA nucleotide-binding domain protein [Deltaproteobacteria bacterium]|nr:DNA integrity scanning protein DisA nucleotide-binding domain protein [Deltaproteobacteria bacterium]
MSGKKRPENRIAAHAFNEEAAVQEELEELKSRITLLHKGIPCLKQCSRLSTLLQKMYEIREGLNQLEKGLLQTHLKCCISPNLKIPEAVILSLSRLSEKRHGALIVMEHEDNLDEHLQGGTIIEAAVSAPILQNIFYPGSPLHDGAVIIRNRNVHKASVLLPLAPHTSELEALGLGTRHRAALGLSQVSDALVIVVSEEKGWISIALQGQLYPNLGTFALLEKLEHTLEDGKQPLSTRPGSNRV